MKQTQTCITWELNTIDLMDKTLQTSLCYILINIPYQDKLSERLFHAISKMNQKDSFFFHFQPQKVNRLMKLLQDC